MIDYYEYETSPRKLEPDYGNIQSRSRKTVKKQVKKNKPVQSKKTVTKRNLKHILKIVVGFIALLTISYRYSIINTSFNEKEALKKELAEVKKVNDQLQVSIEEGMNINVIEKEAKEKLGMQKLDNSQKVYVNLDKQDYTEYSADTIITENEETWWGKLLKDLFNIK